LTAKTFGWATAFFLIAVSPIILQIYYVLECVHSAGVEDGQTVRMPVGNKEIFITFKVSDKSVRSCCFRVAAGLGMFLYFFFIFQYLQYL